jgi:ubiquinone biosynthesis protein COQ9
MLIDSLENKQKILHNFLELCPVSGWNNKTLEDAFRQSEIDDKFLPFIFENGCVDLADFFIRQIDEKMKLKAENLDLAAMKIRDKIKNLVKIRLDINQQYKPQLQKLIQFYTHPKNFIFAFKNAYKTADLMWNLAGDNATDFNFYSKRITLAKIYIRVLSCFVKDDSNNSQKTLDLLDKEIEKVMKFAAFKFKVKNQLSQAGDFFEKAHELKNNFCQDPKNLIKKLPFFRLKK